MNDPLIALVALFCVIALPVLALTLIVIAKILRGSRRGALEAEETALMQDIHRSLTRLESRIDALETIVLEKDRKTRPHP